MNRHLIQAPMAGVTDYPCRQLLREVAGRYVHHLYTEMISAKAICMDNPVTRQMLPRPDEQVVVQLFGHDPEVFREAYLTLVKLCPGIIGVDINAGCPVKKVIKTGAGSALMKDPDRIGRILRALRPLLTQDGKSLSLKTRLGWKADLNYLDIAAIAQEEGADWFTLHGRTVEQGYSGYADTQALEPLIKSLRIPVYWSGDIFHPQDAARVLNEFPIQGVMCARGAMGNPWIFESATRILEKGIPFELDKGTKIEAVQRHMALVEEAYPPIKALGQFKKWIAPYTRNDHHVRAQRNRLTGITDWKDFKTELIRTLEVSGDIPIQE